VLAAQATSRVRPRPRPEFSHTDDAETIEERISASVFHSEDDARRARLLRTLHECKPGLPMMPPVRRCTLRGHHIVLPSASHCRTFSITSAIKPY